MSGKMGIMPKIYRPNAPLPSDVSAAARVFGSDVLVALIRHYRMHPGLQKEAAEALDLPAQIVSANTRVLIGAGVICGDPEPWGSRPGRWVVDERRLQELHDALQAFLN